MKIKYMILAVAVMAVFPIAYFTQIAPAHVKIAAADKQRAIAQLTLATLDTLNASATKSDSAFSQINKVLIANGNRFIILGVMADGPRAKFVDTYGTIPRKLVASPVKIMDIKSEAPKYCFTIMKNQSLSTKNYLSLKIEIRSSEDGFYAPIKTISTAMVNRE